MNNNAWKRVREQNKITLYADNKPYQVIDLKDIDDMSEEEYNDKLKDAWFKKTHYETENNKPLGFTAEIFSVAFSLLFIGGIVGTLFWILGSLISGG